MHGGKNVVFGHERVQQLRRLRRQVTDEHGADAVDHGVAGLVDAVEVLDTHAHARQWDYTRDHANECAHAPIARMLHGSTRAPLWWLYVCMCVHIAGVALESESNKAMQHLSLQ
eukprot:m.807109 g.807109  ORF g.807109 m.807109 type:complete len:114 (-) comp23377_c0_seq56:1580-1921(-)